MERFFYMQDGEAKGPVSSIALRKLINDRKVTKDMICPEGTEEWMEFWDAFPDKKGFGSLSLATALSTIVSVLMGLAATMIFKTAPSAIQEIAGILIGGFAILLFFLGIFTAAIGRILKG